ncbi:MAG: hypothetical protein WD607_11635, partial [Candidatus Paceibacterota bacterium]
YYRGWTGSLVPYLESDKAAFETLLDHRNSNVRLWIKDQISDINRRISQEKTRDQERDIGKF